jgi:hypothetical protein
MKFPLIRRKTHDRLLAEHVKTLADMKRRLDAKDFNALVDFNIIWSMNADMRYLMGLPPIGEPFDGLWKISCNYETNQRP